MDIKKSFRPIIENVIAQYLPWAVGGSVFILTWLSRQLNLWQMLLLFLGLFALVIWIINQISIWKERKQKGFSSKTNEQIQSTLENWLLKRQFAVTRPVLDDKDKNLFYFVATDKQGRPINITRTKSNTGEIQLVAGFDIKELAEIPVKDQVIVRARVGFEMARFGVLYQDRPVMAVVIDLSCDDLLTEAVFIASVNKVRQALILLSQLTVMMLIEIKADIETKQQPKQVVVQPTLISPSLTSDKGDSQN